MSDLTIEDTVTVGAEAAAGANRNTAGETGGAAASPPAGTRPAVPMAHLGGTSRATAPLTPLATDRRRRSGIFGLQLRLTGLRPAERKLIQGIADWLIIAGGLTSILINSARHYPSAIVVITLAVVTLLWFFFASAFDAYLNIVLQTVSRSIYAAAQTFMVTGIVYILVATFIGGIFPVIRPRISETLIALLLVGPLLLIRALYSLLLTRTPLRRHLVVVGANRAGHEMVRAIAQYGGTAYEFLGYFDDTPVSASADDPVTAPLAYPISELLAMNEALGIDQIVLATATRTPGLLYSLSMCHEHGIQITPMFGIYQDLTGRVPVEHLGDDWFVALPAHRKSTPYLLVKRGIDIGLTSVFLLVLAPLFPLVALAIRLDSAGPVFFRQARVGRGGRIFRIVKFRSMFQDAEARTGAVWAQRGDPRITRLGRFLRRSRLDELPQLWNVLVGDMSFVGPRPERPEFDEQLESRIPFYRARRAVRPGLTGWAQVCHGYGNTMLDALRKVEYDLYYIKNETLYLDLLILLRTVAVVLRLGGM